MSCGITIQIDAMCFIAVFTTALLCYLRTINQSLLMKGVNSFCLWFSLSGLLTSYGLLFKFNQGCYSDFPWWVSIWWYASFFQQIITIISLLWYVYLVDMLNADCERQVRDWFSYKLDARHYCNYNLATMLFPAVALTFQLCTLLFCSVFLCTENGC